MSYRDMDGEIFLEPTTELTFVDVPRDASFAVFSLATDVPDQTIWYIVTIDPSGSRLTWQAVRGTADAMFDVAARDVSRTTLEIASPFRVDRTPSTPVTPTRFRGTPAALVYAQQETIVDQYGRQQKARRATRVMLACVAAADTRVPRASAAALAVLDLPVAPNGQLYDGPDSQQLTLPLLLRPVTPGEPVPMPVLGSSARWSMVRGGVFPVDAMASGPFLLDGADGLVHLYFQDPERGLQVLHYDTSVTRASYTLPLETGQLMFAGATAGAHLNAGVSIAVADGSDGDHC
jgi:hypothetical protein